MAKMHEKFYKESPELKRKEDGKMGVTKAEKESARTNDGTEGMQIHERHAHERREMNNRHVKEQMDTHHRHEGEQSHHKGDKKEVHARHHAEHKEMHKRHEGEHKTLHSRHEKEHGTEGSGSGAKKISKVSEKSGSDDE